MQRKFRGVRRGSAALLMAGLLLAGAPGAAGAATVYTAGDDDTFWLLSRKFGVPLDKLMAANADIDPLNIYKGLKLIIPDAESNGASGAATFATAGAASSGTTGSASSGTTGSASATASAFAAGKAGEAPKVYREAIRVKATAYTASAEENGIWGAVDYFGNPLSLGTVSVDPDLIPLGSKLYITGYDYDGLPQGGMYAIARDTGGAIKGNRIDIFVPDSRAKALQFGIQYITVYVL
jgi:Uncharacterized protein conserved in bacteria